MGVCIKNMSMPRDCDTCSLFTDTGDYQTCLLTGTSRGYKWSPVGCRMSECPLNEVPESQGGTTDKENLTEYIKWILSQLDEIDGDVVEKKIAKTMILSILGEMYTLN